MLRWVGAVICLVGALIFSLLGVIMLCSTQSIRVFCNTATNRLTITKKTLFNQTEESIPLDKITDVVIQQAIGQRTGMIYRVAIIFDSAREIPLTQSYDGYLTSKIQTAQTLADFLSIKIDLAALVKKDSQTRVLGKKMFFIGLTPMLILFPFIFRQIASLFN